MPSDNLYFKNFSQWLSVGHLLSWQTIDILAIPNRSGDKDSNVMYNCNAKVYRVTIPWKEKEKEIFKRIYNAKNNISKENIRKLLMDTIQPK